MITEIATGRVLVTESLATVGWAHGNSSKAERYHTETIKLLYTMMTRNPIGKSDIIPKHKKLKIHSLTRHE